MTDRRSPNSPRHSQSPRAKRQRFSDKHQVYAYPRPDALPLVERQRSYINYARNHLWLDKIDHTKLSDSAILRMSFPRRNNQFVSDSSTNVTDQNVMKSSSFQLSPNPSGRLRYSNTKKIRKHNLGFVSTKDLGPQGLAAIGDDLGASSRQQWPSAASRHSLPKKKAKSPESPKLTSTQHRFLTTVNGEPSRALAQTRFSILLSNRIESIIWPSTSSLRLISL